MSITWKVLAAPLLLILSISTVAVAQDGPPVESACTGSCIGEEGISEVDIDGPCAEASLSPEEALENSIKARKKLKRRCMLKCQEQSLDCLCLNVTMQEVLVPARESGTAPIVPICTYTHKYKSVAGSCMSLSDITERIGDGQGDVGHPPDAGRLACGYRFPPITGDSWIELSGRCPPQALADQSILNRLKDSARKRAREKVVRLCQLMGGIDCVAGGGSERLNGGCTDLPGYPTSYKYWAKVVRMGAKCTTVP